MNHINAPVIPNGSEGSHINTLPVLRAACVITYSVILWEILRSEPDWHCLRDSG